MSWKTCVETLESFVIELLNDRSISPETKADLIATKEILRREMETLDAAERNSLDPHAAEATAAATAGATLVETTPADRGPLPQHPASEPHPRRQAADHPDHPDAGAQFPLPPDDYFGFVGAASHPSGDA
jgi:hypothetical protein